MGVARSVCAVATQAGKEGQWTASYKLHVSLDGASWDTYKENNVEKVKQKTTNEWTISISGTKKGVCAINITEL